MNRHIVVTIIFGLCFLAIAAVTIPVSSVVYIGASVTIVLHYLLVQFLVWRTPMLLEVLYQYMMCALISSIAGLAWSLINYIPQEWNNQIKANIGFLIVQGLGFLIFLMLGMFSDQSINSV